MGKSRFAAPLGVNVEANVRSDQDRCLASWEPVFEVVLETSPLLRRLRELYLDLLRTSLAVRILHPELEILHVDGEVERCSPAEGVVYSTRSRHL
jgi:hypothetical protein